MATINKINPNVYLAQQIAKLSLKYTKRFLTLVGKPFYYLLAIFFIGLTFFLFLLGHAFRIITIKLAPLLFRILFSFLKALFFYSFNVGKQGQKLYLQNKQRVLYLIKYVKKQKKRKIKRLKAKKPYLLDLSKIKPKFPQLPKIKLPILKLPSIKFRLLLLFFLFFLIVSSSVFVWNAFLKDLPDPKQLAERDIEVSTKIYDRNGILLYNIYKDQNRTPVPLEQIPLRVRLSTLAIEDAEFYQHPGFSIRGIIRAAIKNFQEGELTGGSTITQQLIKNTLLSPEKTITRKIKEVVLAVEVELTFDKDEILEMYLNEVSYGGTAYGIQEAARIYFGKDVDQLSLAEAALLAGLPKSPTKYSPFGPNPDYAIARQKEVLKLMKINGFINEEQLENAQKEEIVFTENRTNIKAPHFVMYVRELLEDRYGKEVVESGGLEVITSLDYQIQKMAEKILKEEVEALSNLNVGNGAVLVINPSTGEILAMVGSKNYFDTKADGNVNVTTRPRQPGSSIKIVNYAYALSNGYTPATILKDTPVKFLVEGQPPYVPKNYDDKFRGFLTLRSAFAESRNIPAVKVLAKNGVDNMFKLGQKMGIYSWTEPSNYGLSLTLGGGEVTLLELSSVYATVANYGKRPELTSVQKITNFKGKVLEENICVPTERKSGFNIANKILSEANAKETSEDYCEGESVLDERVAFILVDILKDNKARAPAFGSNSLLVIADHKEVAVKTGTSNDLRDNLAVGFNQDYLVSVWVGNNDNSPMSRIASGITGATPIFNKIMSTLLSGENNHDWPIPEGIVRIPFCTLTGTLPCMGCPTAYEWFLEENQPTQTCNPELIKEILDARKEGKLLDEAASTQRD